jgi:hypothetical protein
MTTLLRCRVSDEKLKGRSLRRVVSLFDSIHSLVLENDRREELEDEAGDDAADIFHTTA